MEATASAFEVGLRAALTSTTARRRRAEHILRILDRPRSHRRTNKISQWEEHAVVKFGGSLGIDWTKFDFEKFISAMIALIQKLIAIFGGL